MTLSTLISMQTFACRENGHSSHQDIVANTNTSGIGHAVAHIDRSGKDDTSQHVDNSKREGVLDNADKSDEHHTMEGIDDFEMHRRSRQIRSVLEDLGISSSFLCGALSPGSGLVETSLFLSGFSFLSLLAAC